MTRTDHIQVLTSAALLATGDQILPLFSIIEKNYVHDELRKPHFVSLGARENGDEETFAGWINRLRSEDVLKVKLFNSSLQDHALQAHILAAFAGPSDLLLEITTKSQIRTFVLNSFSSSQYEITPEQFILLLDSQPNKEIAWSRAATLILESNILNQRGTFPQAQAPVYLLTEEGRKVFESLADNLISEVQIESTIHECKFIIPEGMQDVFMKYGQMPYFVDNIEHVYLNPSGDVSSGDILLLVESQLFEEKLIWESLNASLTEYAYANMTPVPVDQWRKKIEKMEHDLLQKIVNPICRCICTLCEEQHKKRIIPSALSDKFGPDDLELKRAAARSKSENDRWVPESKKQHWEYYAFEQIKEALLPDIPGADMARKKFITALEAIKTFAAKIKSPFEESFNLSLYILETEQPGEKYNEEHFELLAANLISAGFSEHAVAKLREAQWIGELFKMLGWRKVDIYGMLAIAFADVFGGMGSWNDQQVEQDHEKYQEFSATLYSALRNYFASLLSSQASRLN
ncbi:hypothetical protein [Flavitalea sp.]|nr:hypothetical protein [Flavitalea sp.]